MSNQPNPDKRQVGLRIDLDTCRRVEKKYTLPGDEAKCLAFIRALEDATREVRLDASDYAAILAESRANVAKRRTSK